MTLKRIEITTFKEGESLSANPRSYIEEYITDEVYNNITLDISQVKPTIQGDYPYYIIYKGVTYQGKVIVRNPGPTVYTPNNNNSEEESSDNSSLENPQTPEETNIPTT